MKNKINILDTYFNHINFNDLVNQLSKRVEDSSKTFVVTANPEIVMYGKKDSEYLNIINDADYVIADGYGIILGSKIIGNELPERIAGFDLMNTLLEKGNDLGWSAYFIGAKIEVIENAVTNISNKYPNLHISGWQNGYVDVNSKELIKEIAAKKPDLIFAGLGFPKQEKWIVNSLPSFEKGLFIGVGGSFDVWAGTAKRAPQLWQNLNLEWLYRLIQQPSRWRRMSVLPVFVIKMINERRKLK